MSPRGPYDEVLPVLHRLHEEVDARVAALSQQHADRLQCRRGCHHCCVDDLTVFEVEAERIRRYGGEVLQGHSPHPPGACAFLDDDGACRIYPHRPYVCRTQGLPLRWIGENEEEQFLEYRDICPLNENDTAIESLAAEDCWTLGPIEGRLAALQIEADGGELRRVRLRDLFEES